MFSYLYWQFFVAPLWLAELIWNLQRALVKFFSVPFMIRTLFAYWHRDAVKFRGGLSNLFTVFAWNLISRVIGFLIRSCVIIIWLVSEVIFLALVGLVFIAFMLAPFVAVYLAWLAFMFFFI